jgi:hypothetical protein
MHDLDLNRYGILELVLSQSETPNEQRTLLCRCSRELIWRLLAAFLNILASRNRNISSFFLKDARPSINTDPYPNPLFDFLPKLVWSCMGGAFIFVSYAIETGLEMLNTNSAVTSPSPTVTSGPSCAPKKGPKQFFLRGASNLRHWQHKTYGEKARGSTEYDVISSVIFLYSCSEQNGLYYCVVAAWWGVIGADDFLLLYPQHAPCISYSMLFLEFGWVFRKTGNMVLHAGRETAFAAAYKPWSTWSTVQEGDMLLWVNWQKRWISFEKCITILIFPGNEFSDDRWQVHAFFGSASFRCAKWLRVMLIMDGAVK